MEEWKEYKLNEVATLTTGFPFDGNKYSKEGIRVVRGDNVTIGSLRWDGDKEKRWNEPFNRASEYTLAADDIVIGMDGSRVGKNRAQVKEEDLPLYLAQRVACIRHNEKTSQSFLYYHIFSKPFEDYIKAVQTGTSIPHISLKQIGDFSIKVPPKNIQEQIAAILKSLDCKIEINKRINDNLDYQTFVAILDRLSWLKQQNDNLEQQAQALFKSWFVDFEPFRDGEFVESELGMIPQGWRAGTLGELCNFKRGKNLLTKDAIPGEVPVVAGGLEPSCYHNVANTKAPVVTVSGSGANAGFMRMYYQEVWASDCSFIDSTCGNLFFVYCFLAVNKWLLKHAQTGAVQPHVKPADIHNFELVIPPKDVIGRFQRVVADTFVMRGNIEKESHRLATLRDVLLPRLMSGELKINEINE